jgi:hypothetical protein
MIKAFIPDAHIDFFAALRDLESHEAVSTLVLDVEPRA